VAQPLPVSETAPAVILAGGFGTRLRAVTGDNPKVLAPVAGRPFIEHLLLQLAGAGFRQVVLCTGFRADAVSAALGDGSRYGLRLRYSREEGPLGTGGALRRASAFLDEPPGPALVMNGDSYVRADLAALMARHRQSGAPATLLLARVEDCSRFGAVTLEDSGRILRFEEKGRRGPGLVNAGIYVVEPAVREAIPAGRPVSLEKEIFPTLAAHGVVVDAPLVDIGTPDSYAAAQELFG
jgi:D-glycero-alpha-D-manno-heptose 1-phosphate guanylyltransferase